MFDIAPEAAREAMKVGGRSAGRLTPIHVYLETAPVVLWLVALVAALLYGVFFLRRPPSVIKTVVKMAPVVLLAVAAIVTHSPLLLVVGLILSAVGDGFLAGDPQRWLPLGLASFLAAHLAYVALFCVIIFKSLRVGSFALGPAAVGLMAISAVAAIGMLWWLWADLGRLRAAVAAYVLAILAMVCTSLALPSQHAPAPLGALLFFLSDAILSLQLFKQRFEGRLGQWAVWAFYFLGQLMIASGFTQSF